MVRHPCGCPACITADLNRRAKAAGSDHNEVEGPLHQEARNPTAYESNLMAGMKRPTFKG